MDKLLKKMSIGRIAALVLSVLTVAFGVHTLSLGLKGLGDVEAYSGPLNIEEGAWDERFDIYLESPILIRKVEMYQWVEDTDTGRYSLQFMDHYVSAMRQNENDTLSGARPETHYNPQFPAEPKSEIFCGRVSIGDSGLYLGNEILEKLALDSYIYFDKQIEKIPVSGLADRNPVIGLEAVDDYTYGTIGTKGWQHGDIRVTWYTVSPESLAEIYTAAGEVENGIIGNDGVTYLYDSAKTLDEINEEFSKGNTTTGTIILSIGIIAVIASIWPLILPYIESLLKKANIRLPKFLTTGK